jgi:hypothetical protein
MNAQPKTEAKAQAMSTTKGTVPNAETVPVNRLAAELGVTVQDIVWWFKVGLVNLSFKNGQWTITLREVNALRERIANGTQQRLPVIR